MHGLGQTERQGLSDRPMLIILITIVGMFVLGGGLAYGIGQMRPTAAERFEACMSIARASEELDASSEAVGIACLQSAMQGGGGGEDIAVPVTMPIFLK